jgi:hypothetical protein
MKRWGWLGLMTCGVLSVASGTALAEYRHRIVLLEHESDDDDAREITTRVRAELRAAGFDVVVLPITDEDPKRAVESAGHELHPASVLLVERLLSNSNGKRGDAGAELWLADRMLRKTVVLRLKPKEDDPSGEAARVAVQAVELVKARLAELAVTREHEPPAPPPLLPQSRPPATAAGRGPHPNLTLGIGLLEGFQEGQQVLTPVLRLGVALPERWTGELWAVDLRGSFVGLGGAARIERGPGAATVRHTAIGFDAIVRFFPRQRVQPFVSLGTGVLVLDVVGAAPDPYRNSSFRTLSGLINAGGGLWLEPLAGFGVVLEGQLMNASSKTVVRIAGEDAAEVAAPLLLLSGGLMAEF